jgi:hypothetical protein
LTVCGYAARVAGTLMNRHVSAQAFFGFFYFAEVCSRL